MKKIAVAGIVLLVCGGTAAAQNSAPAVSPSAAKPTADQPATPPATPQNHPPKGADAGQICKIDLAQFCSAVQPGMGRLIACLNAHKADLHAECRQRITQIYEIESDLAAKAHEPLDQFLAEAYARKEHEHEILPQQPRSQDKQSAGDSGSPATGPATSPPQTTPQH
ncbi:MAG: cysteine rich repeat-containing protein [Rhizomicrobium sp.]